MNFVLWFDHNFIYQISKICIVGWHLEISEANTITDVIKRAHLDSGEPSFTGQKKRMTTHFLSLVKPSPIHFLSCVEKNPSCVVFFLWATACKEGHIRHPKRGSFTGNVLLGENDHSISFKGSLFDAKERRPLALAQRITRLTTNTRDSWQVSLFFKLVL